MNLIENKTISKVEDLENFHEKTMSTFHQNLFRGHEKDSYFLETSLLREIKRIFGEEIDARDLNKVALEYETFLHTKFKEKITNKKIGDVFIQFPLSNYSNFLIDWYLLFQERHLELPSRLIDWSDKPSIALYFAVNNKEHWDENGHVWVFRNIHDSFRNSITNIDIMRKRALDSYKQFSANLDEGKGILDKINPFEIQEDVQLHFPYNTENFKSQIANKRRLSQGGKFIASGNTSIQMTFEEKGLDGLVGLMEKLIIPADCKEKIYKELIENSYYEDLNKKILPKLSENTTKTISALKEEAERYIKEFYKDLKDKI